MRTARIPRELPAPGAALARLGSARLTLGLLPVLAIAVVLVGQDAGPPSWTLAAPLAMLALNLAAAIATHAAFRRQPALLAFHLCLLAIVVLAAAGRLTYLKGSAELSQGEEFAGALVQVERGPWHGDGLERVRFTNEGFRVDYDPGLRRGHTRNLVSFRDAGGGLRRAEVGDDVPLRLGGYRFYTTSNKGFAPEFRWVPRRGSPARGTVHLPSFPAELARQEAAWTPPGGARALSTRLEIEERVVDIEGRWTLASPPRHRIVVGDGGVEHALLPGDAIELDAGTLHYAGLRLWMGYSVFHDWSLPWMLAAALLAAACLGWHFIVRFRQQSWLEAGARRGP